MDYPKFIASNQKEESISIQRVNRNHVETLIIINDKCLVDSQHVLLVKANVLLLQLYYVFCLFFKLGDQNSKYLYINRCKENY